MQTHAFRLTPGQDLRVGVIEAARARDYQAPFVLTCVGSLSRAAIRMAGRPHTEYFDGNLEIVSLVGTMSPDGPHLHISVSDAFGRVTGGHLQEGSIVRTTAELVIAELDDVVFRRPIDPATTWDELVVEPR